ncbi:Ribosomal RNA methyltransferase (FmrO) [compost metagenome]
MSEQLSSLKQYVAVDKDQTSIKIVNCFAKSDNQQSLIAHKWDLAGGWNDLYNITGIQQYDFAFIMKLLPLLSRQNRGLINTLKQIPAKFVLITGSKTSMTKKINIEKRESAIILDFIHTLEWEKLHKIDMSEEFGWIVQTHIK